MVLAIITSIMLYHVNNSPGRVVCCAQLPTQRIYKIENGGLGGGGVKRGQSLALASSFARCVVLLKLDIPL